MTTRMRLMGGVLFIIAVGLMWTTAARAYIGDSFISIPWRPGHWPGEEHRNWIRVEANEWSVNAARAGGLGGFGMGGGGFRPAGAAAGSSGRLTVMVGKTSPDLSLLLDLCTNNTAIPELTYSEGSGRGRPAAVPAFWKYKLTGVEIVDCPNADGAGAQAFVLTFKNVEWLNYDPAVSSARLVPPDVKPIEPAARKKVKAYLITWLAIATDIAEDQCPAINLKPSDEEVFRYMSPDQVAAIRKKNGEKGLTPGTETERRGPHGLNANLLPAIVPDPGLHEPRSRVAFGMDLDNDDGSGPPPAGIRKHENFMSPDGRKGIDNELFRVVGCIPGFRGKKGYRNQTDNARRADGNIVTLFEVSDIDDEKNDDRVDVAIIHAMDKPIRDTVGAKFIPNYTFRATDDPAFTLYNIRVPGRIVNGVVMSDVIPSYAVHSGQGTPYDIIQARIRLDPQTDGSVRGFIAGYQDWRYLATNRASGYSEGLFSYQMPGLYYALKRHADGLQDPATGEFTGISTVYEMDTVPAFLTAARPKSSNAPKPAGASVSR